MKELPRSSLALLSKCNLVQSGYLFIPQDVGPAPQEVTVVTSLEHVEQHFARNVRHRQSRPCCVQVNKSGWQVLLLLPYRYTQNTAEPHSVEYAHPGWWSINMQICSALRHLEWLRVNRSCSVSSVMLCSCALGNNYDFVPYLLLFGSKLCF